MASEQKLVKLKVDAQGRVVIPVEVRREFGIEPGQVVTAVVENGQLVISSFDRWLADLRALFKDVPNRGSMVDELIADRREEVRREEEEDREWLQASSTRPHSSP